jgi:hypothetical protein
MRLGWYWIFVQAVPDDLDQVAEAGGGEVSEHAALEHRPDALGLVDLGVSPVSNGHVKPEPADMISAEPRTLSSRAGWVLAAVLAAALAVAIAVAVHYRAEAAALRQHPRPVTASRPPAPGPVTLSSRTVTLPSYGTLNSLVTIASARFSGGLEQIVVSAHITGGRPHNGYTLYGFDCTGSTGYQPWAAGMTDAHGSGNLTGHAWAVSLTDEYWLYLSPSLGLAGPGIHVSFTTDGRFSVGVPVGEVACSNS